MTKETINIVAPTTWLEKRKDQVGYLRNRMRSMQNLWGNNSISLEEIEEVKKQLQRLYDQIECAIAGHPDAIDVGDTDHIDIRCPVCDDSDGEELIQ